MLGLGTAHARPPLLIHCNLRRLMNHRSPAAAAGIKDMLHARRALTLCRVLARRSAASFLVTFFLSLRISSASTSYGSALQ